MLADLVGLGMSMTDAYAVNMAEHRLLLAHNNWNVLSATEEEEPEESQSLGDFAFRMAKAGMTETTIKPLKRG